MNDDYDHEMMGDPDDWGRSTCPVCGVILGLALTLLISFGAYKAIQHFHLTLPVKAIIHKP